MLLIVFNIWVLFKNSNACGLPDHNRTRHNKKEHEKQEWQGRHTVHGSVNGKMHSLKLSTKKAQSLGQVKGDIDHILCEYLTCVCVCNLHWLFNKTSQPCLRFYLIQKYYQVSQQLWVLLDVKSDWLVTKDWHFCCF